jgi:hypothetical protein
LLSIAKQTYSPIETIVVPGDGAAQTREAAREFDAITIGPVKPKGEARNEGVRASHGDLLLLLDSDMVLSSSLIGECASMAKDGFDALVIPEVTERKGYFSICRSVEKESYAGSRVEAVRFVTRKAFNAVKGFNPDVSGPDEYDFDARLRAAKFRIGRVSASITVVGPVLDLPKKFRHGINWPVYSSRHRGTAATQVNVFARLKLYLEATQAQPALLPGILVLKLLDAEAFLFGLFLSKIAVSASRSPPSTGRFRSYEERMFKGSLGNRFVDWREERCIESILDRVESEPATASIAVDLGAGEGRWSRLLARRGYDVLSIDRSKEACAALRNGPLVQFVIRADMQALPLRRSVASLVFGFRSVKYAANFDGTMREIRRIVNVDGAVVIEMPNNECPFYFWPQSLVRTLRLGDGADWAAYLSSAKMLDSRSCINMMESSGLILTSVFSLMMFPHAVYSRINSTVGLRLVETFEHVATRLLPRRLSARSFIYLSKPAVFARGKLPLVSVVIPTYNKRAVVSRCVKSVLESNYPQLEVIVVDDHSSDGTCEALRSQYPEIEVIRNDREQLLAGSRNVGVQAASGDLIFLLDDDNVVHQNAIEELATALSRFPGAGIAGPVMYFLSAPSRVWCSGVRRNYLTSLTKIQKSDPSKLGIFSPYFTEDLPNALMVRRIVFDAIGLFDGRNFPIHYDEGDLCKRARTAGYYTVVVPNARIWHDIPPPHRALGNSRTFHAMTPMRAYYVARNRIVFMRIHCERWKYVVFAACFLPFLTLLHMVVVLASVGQTAERYATIRSYSRGVRDGLLGIKRNLGTAFFKPPTEVHAQ